ncbi:unnamed protein product [Allacma fusca]|uniref:Uncharacterized protein n=1 Tax=Allacma fusca TaxID=39272 RepID=A0A8J2KE57_9HEXA|nr:unnamed protein product [Allacma fusca]
MKQFTGRYVYIVRPPPIQTGTTLHKAFKLPVEKTSAVQHKPLRGQYLQNLRNSLKNLKLVIIDEFSV